jgi:type IV pilus assembly protein PilO
MATTGVMADFARLPNQRKVLVFVVIGAALGLLYFQFVLKPLNADLAQAEQEQQTKSQLDKKLAAQLPEYEEKKKNVNKLKAIIEENQKALPTEAEVPAFFETLERKVTEAGVEINKWQKKGEEPIEQFVKVPVEIEITGTFMQIKRFFASLVQKDVVPQPATSDNGVEERERVISIENLSLFGPTVRNHEIILTARFTAVTFRQEDRAPAAPPPPPAAGSAPAPKAAPPMPSAGTPAGAKARVEDSIKKGDTTDRNATGVDEAKTPAGSGAPAGGGSARLKGGI